MDERVTKCLEAIGEAFKTLVTSANNTSELIGLMAMVLSEFQETYEKAIDEGVEELEEREEEGN